MICPFCQFLQQVKILIYLHVIFCERLHTSELMKCDCHYLIMAHDTSTSMNVNLYYKHIFYVFHEKKNPIWLNTFGFVNLWIEAYVQYNYTFFLSSFKYMSATPHSLGTCRLSWTLRQKVRLYIVLVAQGFCPVWPSFKRYPLSIWNLGTWMNIFHIMIQMTTSP